MLATNMKKYEYLARKKKVIYFFFYITKICKRKIENKQSLTLSKLFTADEQLPGNQKGREKLLLKIKK